MLRDCFDGEVYVRAIATVKACTKPQSFVAPPAVSRYPRVHVLPFMIERPYDSDINETYEEADPPERSLIRSAYSKNLSSNDSSLTFHGDEQEVWSSNPCVFFQNVFRLLPEQTNQEAAVIVCHGNLMRQILGATENAQDPYVPNGGILEVIMQSSYDPSSRTATRTHIFLVRHCLTRNNFLRLLSPIAQLDNETTTPCYDTSAMDSAGCYLRSTQLKLSYFSSGMPRAIQSAFALQEPGSARVGIDGFARAMGSPMRDPTTKAQLAAFVRRTLWGDVASLSRRSSGKFDEVVKREFLARRKWNMFANHHTWSKIIFLDDSQ